MSATLHAYTFNGCQGADKLHNIPYEIRIQSWRIHHRFTAIPIKIQFKGFIIMFDFWHVPTNVLDESIKTLHLHYWIWCSQWNAIVWINCEKIEINVTTPVNDRFEQNFETSAKFLFNFRIPRQQLRKYRYVSLRKIATAMNISQLLQVSHNINTGIQIFFTFAFSNWVQFQPYIFSPRRL